MRHQRRAVHPLGGRDRAGAPEHRAARARGPRGAASRDRLRRRPPTSTARARSGASTTPGSPFDPGCTYASDAIALGQGEPPVAYAHIVARAGRSPAARPPVLVLLLLQPVQRPARGRLGDDPARLRRRHGRGGAVLRSRSRSATPSTTAASAPTGRRRSSRRRAPTRSSTRPPGSHANYFSSDALAGPQRERGVRLRRHDRARRGASSPRRASVREPDRPGRGRRLARRTRATGARRREGSSTRRPARTPTRSGPRRSTGRASLRDSSISVPAEGRDRRHGHRLLLLRRRGGVAALRRHARLAAATAA